MLNLKALLAPYLTPDTFALVYLTAGVLFTLGLKGLAHPRTARRGNAFAMSGMLLAVVMTLLHPAVVHYGWIAAGLLAGAAIGVPLALRIKMTDMPQLVAILHSFVGLAAVVVAVGLYLEHRWSMEPVPTAMLVEVFVGAFIGAITFTGSLVAFGKLQGIFRSAPVVFAGQHILNLLIFILMVSLGTHFVVTQCLWSLGLMLVLAFGLGITLIIPIGGADMPVIVSMLNSYSGWAAAATGFTLNNILLIITGALVGSSGAILSYIMCRAMNRSFISVILGGFGAVAADDGGRADAAEKGIREAAAEDAGFMMLGAGSVIIVPGYGMAVAQAQHAIKEVYELLTEKGVEVKFAIHPVAGRMPGHMNVLLAEADVPYDAVFELEEINNAFSSTDVVYVVGANDVVNPDAKENPASPLYGMPILEVHKAKTVFVNKRSMNTGYAGVDNSLFFRDNTYLVFGDAKAVAERLAAVLKEG